VALVPLEPAGLFDPVAVPVGVERNAVVVDVAGHVDRHVAAAGNQRAVVGQRGARQVDVARGRDHAGRAGRRGFVRGALAFLVRPACVAAAGVTRVPVAVALVQRDRRHGRVDHGRRGDGDITGRRLDRTGAVGHAIARRERHVAHRRQRPVQVLDVRGMDGQGVAGRDRVGRLLVIEGIDVRAGLPAGDRAGQATRRGGHRRHIGALVGEGARRGDRDLAGGRDVTGVGEVARAGQRQVAAAQDLPRLAERVGHRGVDGRRGLGTIRRATDIQRDGPGHKLRAAVAG